MAEEDQAESAEEEQPEPAKKGREPIGAREYVAPVMMREAFHCMHCGVYAQQWWVALSLVGSGSRAPTATPIRRASCMNCRGQSFWLADSPVLNTTENPRAPMLWPWGAATAPLPHADMPDDPKADYDEARAIVDRSPRGAVALLRLAVQKLCKALGESGENINADIASLVQKGLAPQVQQALDVLRVIGNNAVHPGQIDLRDDRDTALALFGLLNFIVEQQITRPKELASIYGSLPAGALAQIQKRNSTP
jgi:hypothetical protein